MCKAVEHDTHPTKSLTDVVAKVKMTLDTKLNQCSNKLRRSKASTVKGEELDIIINDAEQEELKAVDDQCSQFIEAIDQEAAKFKDKILFFYHLLQEQSAEFKSCSNTKDIAQNLRDQGIDNVIIKKDQIEQLIYAALVKIDPKPIIHLNNKLFSPAKIIDSKLILLIGILQDSTDVDREVARLRPEKILSPLSNNWINVLAEEARRNFINRSKSIHSEINVLPEEVRRNFINRSKSINSETFKLLDYIKILSEKTEKLVETQNPIITKFRNANDKSLTECNVNSVTLCTNLDKDIAELNKKFKEVKQEAQNRIILDVHSKKEKMKNALKLVQLDELQKRAFTYQKNFKRLESTEASEGIVNRPIHHNYVSSDHHHTTCDPQDNRIGMPEGCRLILFWQIMCSMINKTWFIQDNQILISEVNTDISSDESRSTFESTLSRLYRNVIRNETSRMMSSIGIVAEHLFGLERSRIFLDLLDEELCHFGSALSDSVPNMAESTVRQNVISLFEHASDTMNRLMTLLLSCPDSNILQQMPVQSFISLMKSVIKYSLKAQTKGREKLSFEGNIYTMVDPKDFERALGEEIPEDVLNRLRNKDEMVVHRFVDTRLERHQPSDRKENRPIQSIYFPSDCRLFIYIPTANGSYWHHSDMRRADRIRRYELDPKISTSKLCVNFITNR